MNHMSSFLSFRRRRKKNKKKKRLDTLTELRAILEESSNVNSPSYDAYTREMMRLRTLQNKSASSTAPDRPILEEGEEMDQEGSVTNEVLGEVQDLVENSFHFLKEEHEVLADTSSPMVTREQPIHPSFISALPWEDHYPDHEFYLERASYSSSTCSGSVHSDASMYSFDTISTSSRIKNNDYASCSSEAQTVVDYHHLKDHFDHSYEEEIKISLDQVQTQDQKEHPFFGDYSQDIEEKPEGDDCLSHKEEQDESSSTAHLPIMEPQDDDSSANSHTSEAEDDFTGTDQQEELEASSVNAAELPDSYHLQGHCHNEEEDLDSNFEGTEEANREVTYNDSEEKYFVEDHEEELEVEKTCVSEMQADNHNEEEVLDSNVDVEEEVVREACSKESDEKCFGEDREEEIEVERISETEGVSETEGDSHCEEEFLDSNSLENNHEACSIQSDDESVSDKDLEKSSIPVMEHTSTDSSATCAPSSIADDASVEETTRDSYESLITSFSDHMDSRINDTLSCTSSSTGIVSLFEIKAMMIQKEQDYKDEGKHVRRGLLDESIKLHAFEGFKEDDEVEKLIINDKNTVNTSEDSNCTNLNSVENCAITVKEPGALIHLKEGDAILNPHTWYYHFSEMITILREIAVSASFLPFEFHAAGC